MTNTAIAKSASADWFNGLSQSEQKRILMAANMLIDWLLTEDQTAITADGNAEQEIEECAIQQAADS